MLLEHSDIHVSQIGTQRFDVGRLCIIIQFKQINQPDATVLQVYYLMFCVTQHVSGTSAPIIRSLKLH